MVLVVDDEPAILRVISFVLRDMGCETYTAGDAERALDLLQSVRPDLMIVDVKLPGMSGVDLARRVKADQGLSSVPVVLMSAYGEPIFHPGDGFLSKPFDLEELSDLAAQYLARS
ncbi:MAG: response regulator [Chloroflexi bacterium]|nr:response regulator [Chloroflexota bacterium]